MQEFFEWANEYIDENFAHVFVLTIMLAVPFIVAVPLESAGLWTVFMAFYFLCSIVMGHFLRASKEFRKLNHDKSLWGLDRK